MAVRYYEEAGDEAMARRHGSNKRQPYPPPTTSNQARYAEPHADNWDNKPSSTKTNQQGMRISSFSMIWFHPVVIKSKDEKILDKK